MGSNANGSESYYRGVHGLRGLAALAVFGVHYNQIVDVDFYLGEFDLYLLLKNGEYGVGLFFILSGFLLSQPFWRTIFNKKPWPNIKHYFILRAARILPAYYVALTLIILSTGYWRFPQTLADILLHYSFLFNYVEFSIFSINAPFWSLAVELQFYCLLPLLFWIVRKQTAVLSTFYLFCFACLSYGLHLVIISQVNTPIMWPENDMLTWIRPHGAVITHSLLSHIPHFSIGILTGGFLYRIKSSQPQLFVYGSGYFDAAFVFCACIIFLLLSTSLGDYIQIPFGQYGLPLIPLLMALVILSAPATKYIVFFLESYLIKMIGKLSYGIYIYHLPALIFVDEMMAKSHRDASEQWYLLLPFSMTLPLLLSEISFYFIEQPVLKLTNKKFST